MIKQMLEILTLTAMIAAFSLTATAWDEVGHKLTAYIAWQQMTPAAREKAFKLLMRAPEDSDLSVFYVQDSRPAEAKQRELFMIAATWADIVRDRNFKTRFDKYHKGNWHYSDSFWTDENGKIKDLPNPAGEEGGQAVNKLVEFTKLLRDSAAADADKAIALAWILHLAGDIHQPLHTSARITQYDPKGDQGGNLFLLTPKGTKREDQLNLHWLWDSIIVRLVERRDTPDDVYFPMVAGQITKMYPLEDFGDQTKNLKFDEWQKEGVKLAQTKVYTPDLKFFTEPSYAYKRDAFNLGERQIALAGYRMGALLNNIFDVSATGDLKDNKVRGEAKSSGSTIGQGANDSWIWFKTRAALLNTAELRESTINIDVSDDIITLRGTVANAAQKAKAEQVAKNIEGSKGVKNMLKVLSK